MHRRHNLQVPLLAFIDLETRVSADHALRVFKRVADQTRSSSGPMRPHYYWSGLSGPHYPHLAMRTP